MKNKNDLFIFGLAIFAMFFGAGNLIFPPQIGVVTGKEWLIATSGFFLTGICLPVAGLVAFSRAANVDKFADRVSPKFNTAYFTLLITAIGPMLGIPRTAATAFEMGIEPNITGLNPLMVSFIYFIVVYFLVINPSKLINNIGKYLTPIILSILALVIIKGSLMKFGVPGDKTITQDSFSYGFFGGYQTMDAITSVILGSIIVKSLKSSGYKKQSDQRSMIIKAGTISGIGMALVYGGLLYLGAMANGNGLHLNSAELVMYFASTTFGTLGIIAFGLCITIACLTTSVALTAIASDFFSEKLPFSYKTVTIAICLISTLLAANGIGFIINIAVPILTILYPATITLIVLNIAKVDDHKIFKGGTYTALAFSIIEVISKTGISKTVHHLFSIMPLSKEGFAWLLPTLLVTISIGIINSRSKVAVEIQ